MIDFDWIEPASLPEALHTLHDYGADARPIAGGTWITLVMQQGFLFPSALIALRGVPGLDTITVDPVLGLSVGAVAERPERFPDAEALAGGKVMTPALAQQIADAYADSIDPIDDVRGSSWYRDRMIRGLVRRAILAALEREVV